MLNGLLFIFHSFTNKQTNKQTNVFRKLKNELDTNVNNENDENDNIYNNTRNCNYKLKSSAHIVKKFFEKNST